MLAHISILDLLHISQIYQEILDSTLHEPHIPIDTNATKFYKMVGHLSTSYALSFKNLNIRTIDPDHILPFQIIVMVSNFVVKWVMIDNGSDLNLCTLKFIK